MEVLGELWDLPPGGGGGVNGTLAVGEDLGAVLPAETMPGGGGGLEDVVVLSLPGRTAGSESRIEGLEGLSGLEEFAIRLICIENSSTDLF